MAQNISNSLEWQMKFAINWSKVNCILKRQTLTFWSTSSTKDQNSSKHIKIGNLFIKKSRNQEIKISFWKVKISKLRNFSLSIFFLFFHNFEQFFHYDARWFKGNFQHESCRSPWNLQLFFTQLLQKGLGSHVII